MKKYLPFLLYFASIQISFSQITFEKTFGNPIDVERGFSAKQTYDGGYVVLGTNYGDETGSGSVMLIKTDSLGNQVWSKGWTDFSLWQSFAKSLKITSDSGFIITGGSYTIAGGIGAQDVFLLKTDKNGNEQWVVTYDSISSYPAFGTFHEYGNDLLRTNDGGYLVTGGAANKELILLKTDSIGNKQWVVKDTGQSQATGNSLMEAENNTYLVIGSTTANFWNTPKMYLTKYDSNGNKIWGQTYGWSQGNYALGYSVKVNPDGEYVLLGLGRYNASQYGEMLLIKTDTAGNTLWENSFLKNNYSAGYALDITNDSGYILTGYSFDAINGYSVYLVKTDSSGTQLWDSTYSGDMGFSVQQTFDNGYIIASTKFSDVYLLKTTSNGIVLSSNEFSKHENTVSIYPNPAFGSINMLLKTQKKIQFDIEIADLYGRKIASKNNLDSNTEIILERELFKSGINFVSIRDDSQILYVKKVVVK